MATKIQVRRDAAADWTSTNPTLAAGEIGFESDTNKFKIGDGATAWTSLNYAPEGYATTSYVDTQDANIASDTLTFTNKTFDANGTGNSISNIETADIAAGTLVTAAEGIGSNNNDTTIPTSAAVKAYADSVGGGGASTGDITFTGSTIQSPSNADITLEPGGTGDVVMPAISFQDNTITTNRSNDDLLIEANGTGRIELNPQGTRVDNSVTTYSNYHGNPNRVKGAVLNLEESIDVANLSDRRYGHAIHYGTTATSSSSTNNNFTTRACIFSSGTDMDGNDFTLNKTSRGPVGLFAAANAFNSSSSSSSTLNTMKAQSASCVISNFNNPSQDMTITNAFAYSGDVSIETNGTNANTITNGYTYHSGGYVDGSGSNTNAITNHYGFYYGVANGTNNYAFYDATDSLSVFGDVQTSGVSITDNHITSNRSNDHLHISANGTGKVNISNSDAVPEDNLVYTTGFGTINRNRGVRIWESVSAQGDMTTADDRDYGHLLAKEWKLTSGLTSSDSDNRYRAFNSVSAVDLNGAAMTGTSSYSGPQGGNGFVYLQNSNASAATMSNSSGLTGGIYAYPTGGAITATNTYGVRADIDFDGSSASVSGTNGYLFHAAMYSDGGTTSMTNGYGVYISDLSLATNKYAFYDATNSLSVFGDIQTQAVSITDNVISTNRSNDDLVLESNGTGYVQISANGGDFGNYSTNARYANGNFLYHEDLSQTLNTGDRTYKNILIQNIKLAGSQATSTNSNDRWRNQAIIDFDLNGQSTTATSGAYRSRGPMGLEGWVTLDNSASTASTLGNASAGNYGISIYPSGTGDITVTGTTGMGAYLDISQGAGDITITDHVMYESIAMDLYGGGAGSTTITDFYHFRAGANSDGTGSGTITNNYSFYAESESVATNHYAFYDAGAGLSRLGAVILANQSGDPSTVTDSAHIYAKDVSSSSEVFVRDEAGNVTQISPHNEAGEWQYWSQNVKTGKKVRINMEKMIRKLEEYTGETFIENE